MLTLQRNNQLQVYPGWPLPTVNIVLLTVLTVNSSLRSPLSHWVSWILKGSVTPLTEQYLQATINQDTSLQRNQSVVFTVVIPPKRGQLVQWFLDNSTKNVSTFTQNMVGQYRSVVTWSDSFWQKVNFRSSWFPQVNEGVILYDQKMPESVGWLATDSFTFTISSPPAFLPLHNFTIVISYEKSEHHNSTHPRTKLLSNKGAVPWLFFYLDKRNPRIKTYLE